MFLTCGAMCREWRSDLMAVTYLQALVYLSIGQSLPVLFIFAIYFSWELFAFSWENVGSRVGSLFSGLCSR